MGELNIFTKMYIILGVYALSILLFALFNYNKTKQKYFTSSLPAQITCIVICIMNGVTSRNIQNITIQLEFACGVTTWALVIWNTYMLYRYCKMYHAAEVLFTLALSLLNVKWDDFYYLSANERMAYAKEHFPEHIHEDFIEIDGKNICSMRLLTTWR